MIFVSYILVTKTGPSHGSKRLITLRLVLSASAFSGPLGGPRSTEATTSKAIE